MQAVQLYAVEVVRLLLKAGAIPEKSVRIRSVPPFYFSRSFSPTHAHITRHHQEPSDPGHRGRVVGS